MTKKDLKQYLILKKEVDEIKAYCEERGNSVEFVQKDWYTENDVIVLVLM